MYEVTQGVLDTIMKRKSVRDFLERDVEPEKKQAIYDAILAAPTTENMMMYTVIAVTDPEVRAKLSRQPAMRKAPMILVFCADYRRWGKIFDGMTESNRKPEEGEYQLALIDATLAEFPNARVKLEPTTALCSFYAEAGGLMIGFEGGYNTNNNNIEF